jgi:NAD(P)H-dependent FMN reductase
MSKLKLAVLLGTKRVNNKSQYVARHIARIAESTGEWDVTFVDPQDLELPGDGNDEVGKDPKYTKITEESEAFFIVTPEYNHSFPGTLKRVLDSELSNYIHKPVAVAGVSSGRYAGVRAVAHLAEVLREIGMIMTFTDVNVGGSYDAYNEETGEPNEGNEYIEKTTLAALTELKWMAETLKHGRENIPNKHHEK